MALDRLLAKPALANRMGLAGRERLLREFRREALWMALGEEYRNLLHEKRLPSPQAKAIQTLHAVASSADVASR